MKLALVGCGQLAREVHLPCLRRLDCEVSDLCDPDPEALRQAGRLLPTASLHQQARPALRLPHIQAVIVCAPPADHLPLALAALEAGKHVYLEKPLALDSQQGERIARAARDSGLVLQVGLNLRFHPLILQMRRRFLEAEIGRLTHLRSSFCLCPDDPAAWRRNRAQGGGALLELATHHLDLWCYVTGYQMQQVQGQLSSLRFEKDSATLSARLQGGATAQGFFSLSSAEEEVLELNGDRGRLRLYRYHSWKLEKETAGARGRGWRRALFWLSAPLALPYLRHKRRSPWHEPSYLPALAAFLQSVRAGRLLQGASADQALENLRWLEQAETSGEGPRP